MQYVWKASVVVAVFVGVGLLTAKTVIAHSAPGGIYALQVRLGSAMAGLFAGGIGSDPGPDCTALEAEQKLSEIGE